MDEKELNNEVYRVLGNALCQGIINIRQAQKLTIMFDPDQTYRRERPQAYPIPEHEGPTDV